MNPPSNPVSIDPEAEDHATETQRAVRGEIPPREEHPEPAASDRREGRAAPETPWQID